SRSPMIRTRAPAVRGNRALPTRAVVRSPSRWRRASDFRCGVRAARISQVKQSSHFGRSPPENEKEGGLVRALFISVLGIAALGAGVSASHGQGAPQAKQAAAKAALKRDVLHVQVILDHLGFSPGILDGREGQSLTAALRAYQVAQQLPVTGKIDQRTLQ